MVKYTLLLCWWQYARDFRPSMNRRRVPLDLTEVSFVQERQCIHDTLILVANSNSINSQKNHLGLKAKDRLSPPKTVQLIYWNHLYPLMLPRTQVFWASVG